MDRVTTDSLDETADALVEATSRYEVLTILKEELGIYACEECDSIIIGLRLMDAPLCDHQTTALQCDDNPWAGDDT